MIAKGKVYLTNESLRSLLNIPEEVEIVSVEKNDNIDGIEFNIISKDPIEDLTINVPSWYSLRRVRVPLDELIENK